MTELTFKEVQELVEILGDNEARKILSRKTKTPVPEILGNLKPNGNTVVGPLTKTFVPKDFFRNDNRDVKLHIWEGLKNRVLASADKVSKKPAATLVSYDLIKQMYDREIRAALPENHVFAIDDLWMIADLIENDKLLKNSYANLFYVQVGASVLVVGVYWSGSEWDVDDWDLDGRGRCHDGYRVFSRNG